MPGGPDLVGESRALTADEEDLKRRFVEARGYWSPLWDGVLRLDPAYFAAYLRYSALPWEQGPLPPKVKELIYTAIDASTTHLFEPGLRIHIDNALTHGATVGEIMEVLEITSLLGIETLSFGVPVLLEELVAAGQPVGVPDLDDRRQALRDRYVALRGEWPQRLDGLLALDPDFLESYLGLAETPEAGGRLEPKVRELVRISLDCAVTHLHEPELRDHIRRALGYGATAAEIMEVFELSSVLGVHSCTIGVPLLLEVAAAHGATT